MIACYDLAKCPPTYDVVAFLGQVELERQRRGEDRVDLHILPGPEGGFRRDSLWPRDVEVRRRMLGDVVVPLCRMLPAAGEVVVHETRPRELWGEFGGGAYMVSLPWIVRTLREGCRPLRSRDRVLEWSPRPLITMTLREAEHYPRRNSRMDAWVEAAGVLGERGHNVVVVRDTLRAGDPLEGTLTCPDASRSLERRAALYSAAALNMGVSNGPMWMAVMMDAPVAMLRPVTDEAGGCFDRHFFAQHGVPHGSQLPTSPPHQRLVWEEDTAECIVRAAESALAGADAA